MFARSRTKPVCLESGFRCDCQVAVVIIFDLLIMGSPTYHLSPSREIHRQRPTNPQNPDLRYALHGLLCNAMRETSYLETKPGKYKHPKKGNMKDRNTGDKAIAADNTGRKRRSRVPTRRQRPNGNHKFEDPKISSLFFRKRGNPYLKIFGESKSNRSREESRSLNHPHFRAAYNFAESEWAYGIWWSETKTTQLLLPPCVMK